MHKGIRAHKITERERRINVAINPSLTPIIVESRCHHTFSVLAMDSVSYKFLFF